jgi:tripartite-type tricarboxylate transporter receptor subunit TctC
MRCSTRICHATCSASSLLSGDFRPKGTPREIVARLNAVTMKVLRLPETKERLSREGLDLVGSTPGEFATYLQGEARKWAKAVELSGAKANQ